MPDNKTANERGVFFKKEERSIYELKSQGFDWLIPKLDNRKGQSTLSPKLDNILRDFRVKKKALIAEVKPLLPMS